MHFTDMREEGTYDLEIIQEINWNRKQNQIPYKAIVRKNIEYINQNISTEFFLKIFPKNANLKM